MDYHWRDVTSFNRIDPQILVPDELKFFWASPFRHGAQLRYQFVVFLHVGQGI